MDVMFWVAKVRRRSWGLSVTVRVAPTAADSWRADMEPEVVVASLPEEADPLVAVREGLGMLGLVLSEVTDSSDPVHGVSWHRGVATRGM